MCLVREGGGKGREEVGEEKRRFLWGWFSREKKGGTMGKDREREGDVM